jgi:hypothetical protein
MNIVEITKVLGPAVSIIAIILFVALASFKIYLDYRGKIAERGPAAEAFRVENAPSNLDNLAELLVQNFRILNSFYSESLSQYRTSSIASISIAVLGFVVIIAGVLIALIGNQVTLGSVSSAAGIVGEGAAVLFFKQNKTFQDQMESSLKKLVSSQYLMTSIALARELDGEPKTSEITEINKHLRSLMDVLHDISKKLAV